MMAAGEGGVAARRRVLLFPFPLQGHIAPMFQLAGALHSRGLAVTVIHTEFNAPDAAQYPHYRFVAVSEAMAGAAKKSKDDLIAFILEINGTCEAPFEDRLAALLAEDGAGDEVACLITDVHWLSLQQVARRLGVPAMALRTGSAASFSVFLAYPMLWEKGYLPMQQSMLHDLVPELPPHRVKDLVYIQTADAGDMLRCVVRANEAARGSTGLIINTFDAIEAAELRKLRAELPGVPVFDVGPLHKLALGCAGSLLTPDRSCVAWLDAQPPASVIYVSFGSLAALQPAEFAATAWGLSDSGCRFVWVVRPGLVRGAMDGALQLPDGFEAATSGRGVVVRWAPQQEVLDHGAVGGFWTHGGWNSTVEGICAGVPMMCWPYFADQSENSRYMETVWKVGFEFDGELERSRIAAAVRKLMSGEEGEEMRKRARALAAECAGSVGRSSAAVDRLVEQIGAVHGGSPRSAD